MSPFATALMNSRLAHSMPRIRAAECAGYGLKCYSLSSNSIGEPFEFVCGSASKGFKVTPVGTVK